MTWWSKRLMQVRKIAKPHFQHLMRCHNKKACIYIFTYITWGLWGGTLFRAHCPQWNTRCATLARTLRQTSNSYLLGLFRLGSKIQEVLGKKVFRLVKDHLCIFSKEQRKLLWAKHYNSIFLFFGDWQLNLQREEIRSQKPQIKILLKWIDRAAK